MVNWFALTSLLLPTSASTPPAFTWAQPPIGCVEEVIPQHAKRPCPDLTEVENPITDFPAGIPPQERQIWEHPLKRELTVCRAEEVLRREQMKPGSMRPAAVEISWMLARGARKTDEKIDAIYEASERFGVPAQVLLGALSQESLMAELGISEDGGNFSCGIGQLNVTEWCHAQDSAPVSDQLASGWPVDAIARFRNSHPHQAICSDPILFPALTAPFYKIGMKKLGNLPEYRLSSTQMQGITASQVTAFFPVADAETQNLRFLIAQHFTLHCSEARAGILAKAHELKRLYEKFVPPALRQMETYGAGETFARDCRKRDTTGVYPLQTGWLLADAIYNAGSDSVKAVAFYLRMDRESFSSPRAWEQMDPQLLIESLYGAGRYNPQTNLLEFTDLDGKRRTRTWFKACIVQRHISHLIDHVTLPDVTIADSYEGPGGCEKSTPLFRQKSSGQIER